MRGARSTGWFAAMMSRRDHAAQLVHAGSSMAPCLQPDDVLTVRAEPTLDVGAIVVVRVGERLVAHRLVERSSDGLVLRGDANPRCDPPIRAVVGVVVAAHRAGRAIPLGIPLRTRVKRFLESRA